jgi:cytochrome b561
MMYWIVALLALVELGIGWSLDYIPIGSQGADIASLSHIALGIGLAALVIIIPIWRLFSRPQDRPYARPHWLQIALRISESLLFILLAVTAVTGYLDWAFSSGSMPSWSQWLPPALEVGPHAGARFDRWHEIAAVAATIPILGTLVLLAWGAFAGHRKPHHRRVLVLHEPPPAAASGQAPGQTPAQEPGQAPGQAPDEDLLAKGRAFALRLKIFGAIAFWMQLCLGLIAALLLVVTTSSSYYEENLPSLFHGVSWAHGIVWAYFSLGMLALTVIGFYACILLSRSLKRGELPGGGAESVKRLVSAVNVGSMLGLTLAIIGTAFSIALLISKTVSEPPGIAITDPQAIVRAVDVFVLLANFDIVVAHFAGILSCLWILHRLHHLAWWANPTNA